MKITRRLNPGLINQSIIEYICMGFGNMCLICNILTRFLAYIDWLLNAEYSTILCC